MDRALLWSVGPDTEKRVGKRRKYSVKEKINITNRKIEKSGASLWGVDFRVNKRNIKKHGGSFPLPGYLYVTQDSSSVDESLTGKVSYKTKVEDIDSNAIRHKPREPELRPDEWKDLFYKTYLKLSFPLTPLKIPVEVSKIEKWDTTPIRGEQALRNYILIIDEFWKPC